MENNLRYFEVVWAALRSGLYLTTVNRYLTDEEAGYIVDNCEAQVLVASAKLSEVAAGLPQFAPNCHTWLMTDGVAAGYETNGSENYQAFGYGGGEWSGGFAMRRADRGESADGEELNTDFTQYSGFFDWRRKDGGKTYSVTFLPSYGEDIGKMVAAAGKGDHVHTHNLKTKRW